METPPYNLALYRPWTPAEVPIGAWIREATEFARKYNYFSSIIGVTYDQIMTAENDTEEMFMFFKNAMNHEYSLDKGQTWQVCGILLVDLI